MKPDVPVVMGGFLAALATEIAPNLGGEYSAGNASTMGLALFFAGQEFERAAEIRVRENTEMRELFADAQASDVVADEALRARLREASKGTDESLAISALDQSNAELKTLLIDMQVALEASTTTSAAQLEDKVWNHLVGSAERRKLVLPPTA
ncbi:hypothetical protein CLV47_101425 [Antricoccus suffuscus]|uniref:Uncharacterized protein n=1 Tax=Antricoccus suffuscus TaxID=1629062 RepID=A0A2T1A6S2_9ACTN|nr:hypothetical protein [Antricoccus suffuscus]PRZ44299.1 hypothetical protein CLV47_101425 [Antricoccus suffuscus]